MSNLSVQTLQHIASETGYQVEVLEKVFRLLVLLGEINRDSYLSGRLALKGGTALNVFHLNLDRLSIDIDLNYVGALERTTMVSERPEVEAALRRILHSLDYRVRHRPSEHAGGKWLSSFRSALGGHANLEVDLNFMARQPLFGAARMQSVEFSGISATDILVLDLHEIVAGKLVALFDRCAGRDLFDLSRILLIDGLDWRKIKTAVLAFGACAHRDWRKVTVDSIEDNPRKLRQNLASCLPNGHFSGEIKIDTWIKHTVTLCKEQLDFLFDYTAGEQAFLDGVLEQGKINASLLDVAPDIQDRIAAMPMLAWKCHNVCRNKV